MVTMIREAKCVELKRHGARYVEKLVSGLTSQEQLEFWQKRTESMLNRQREAEKQNLPRPECRG
jgi:hypothetical protein